MHRFVFSTSISPDIVTGKEAVDSLTDAIKVLKMCLIEYVRSFSSTGMPDAANMIADSKLASQSLSIFVNRCGLIMNNLHSFVDTKIVRLILMSGLSEIGDLKRDQTCIYTSEDELFGEGLYVDGYDTLFSRFYSLLSRIVDMNETPDGKFEFKSRNDVTPARLRNAYGGVMVTFTKLIALTYKFRLFFIEEYMLENDYPPITDYDSLLVDGKTHVLKGIGQMYHALS